MNLNEIEKNCPKRSRVWLFTKMEFSEDRTIEDIANEFLLDVRLVCVRAVLTQLLLTLRTITRLVPTLLFRVVYSQPIAPNLQKVLVICMAR